MDEKIKIEGHTVTISSGDQGQLVLDLVDLLEFQHAISAITNLCAIGQFETLEFTVKHMPEM